MKPKLELRKSEMKENTIILLCPTPWLSMLHGSKSISVRRGELCSFNCHGALLCPDLSWPYLSATSPCSYSNATTCSLSSANNQSPFHTAVDACQAKEQSWAEIHEGVQILNVCETDLDNSDPFLA